MTSFCVRARLNGPDFPFSARHRYLCYVGPVCVLYCITISVPDFSNAMNYHPNLPIIVFSGSGLLREIFLTFFFFYLDLMPSIENRFIITGYQISRIGA